ncbi:hypothetical protein [uncultured Zoogloea sp.]|uniref:hypothetical protein n=1 Tax=uncultured Zoogloea sp. TaxID=160237 RepID=UPI00263726A9|nr:hypothetical protein [uncultured Zoogloea sp.]
MPSTATASVSSLLASVHAVARRFLTLVTAEGRQAGLRLLSMLGLALLAAGLAITGWLGLLAGLIVALVQNDIVRLGPALGLAALLSFSGAGGIVLLLMRGSPKPLFAATQRQLGLWSEPKIEAGDAPPPHPPYEREVEEGRMVAHAEYQALRKRLRRRLDSPLIIGGGVLAGIAVGYLAGGRGRTRGRHQAGRPHNWMQVLGVLRVLTPLWLARRSASRALADGGETAAAGERHGS